MLYEITSWFNASVLFRLECASFKLCVEAAVKGGADLHGADLHGADLYGADLYGADLYGANLHGADLYGANLRRANLHGADLYGANLRRADLGRANLHGANLHGADLGRANLHGAVRDGFIISGLGVVPSGIPDNWQALGYEDETTKQIRVEVGCRRFSLDEGRAYWAGKECRHEVLAALDYIEAVLKIRRERAEAEAEADEDVSPSEEAAVSEHEVSE